MAQLEETKAEILKINPDVDVLLKQTDVTSDKEMREVFEAAKEKYGTIDVAVADAGRNGSGKMIAQSESDSFWMDFVR